MCEGVSGPWSLGDAAGAFLSGAWQGACLSVVAITDGARCVREDLQALFGEGGHLLLDWYPLAKRVYAPWSRAAPSKSERKRWEQTLLAPLWHGTVAEALSFLARHSRRGPLLSCRGHSA